MKVTPDYPAECAFELVCDWIENELLADFPPGIDVFWLAEELANRLGQRQELADAVYTTARRWADDNRKKIERVL